MSDPGEERTKETPTAGRAPTAAKREREVERRPNYPNKTILLPDPMVVRDLASALHLKPFKVIADLMELKVFKSPDDDLDFETAALVALKYGCRAERPPPGVLVL
jgi:hypothetical protein